jgi:hypothetical protein
MDFEENNIGKKLKLRYKKKYLVPNFRAVFEGPGSEVVGIRQYVTSTVTASGSSVASSSLLLCRTAHYCTTSSSS